MFPIGNVGLDLEADVHQNWRSHNAACWSFDAERLGKRKWWKIDLRLSHAHLTNICSTTCPHDAFRYKHDRRFLLQSHVTIVQIAFLLHPGSQWKSSPSMDVGTDLVATGH